MKQAVTPSHLRANLYQLLDQVLESGEPIEVLRKGKTLKIIPEYKNRLTQLKPHSGYVNGEKEDIVHIDWSNEWHP